MGSWLKSKKNRFDDKILIYKQIITFLPTPQNIEDTSEKITVRLRLGPGQKSNDEHVQAI